ncbi:MAG: Extracellular ligand-binding receptor [Alphaproteobacteria bacterium]|jgi:branched-chain amino acid transport system substrate-binding protein|nr:Extracellular ligand-binding receptor [Alphaproteobacteria bacterium]
MIKSLWTKFGRGLTATCGLALALGVAATGAQAQGLPAKLTVGGLLPLTGNAGFIGEEIRQGLDSYLVEYAKTRAAAGLPEINVVYVDSQADPRVGFQGYQLLRSRHEAQLIYLTYTSVAIAAAPQANRDQVAMFNVTQGEVTKLGPLFTSMLPAYSIQGEIIVKEAMRRGVKTIALLYENSEAFVVQAKAIENDVCPRLGCKVVASEQIPAGSTDVAAQVTAALAAKPDAVFPIAIATQIVPVVRELHTRSYKGKIFGISDMGGVASTNNGNLIEGAFYTSFAFDDADADYKALREGYKAKHGKELSQYVAMGYQGGQIIAAALKAMKAAGKGWSGVNFVEAQKGGPLPTIAGPVTFLKDGRIVEPMMLVEIKDGKPTQTKRISLAD